MRLDHSFTVPVPVDEAWQVLLDVPRIAPCMPGAALTEFDGDSFAGTVKVKLGPIGLTYRGTGRFVDRDEAARRVVIEASGRDTRAAGTAAATVTATLAPEGDSTRVDVATDLTVTGKPAQFGRGMLADVSGKLIGQFADCLAATIAAQPAPVLAVGETAEEPAVVAAPVAAPVAEPEPIDLLKITGVSGVGRRYGPYVVVAAVVAVVTWFVVRWLRG
jgi:carbon monoxide dehydrogenase subunit G